MTTDQSSTFSKGSIYCLYVQAVESGAVHIHQHFATLAAAHAVSQGYRRYLYSVGALRCCAPGTPYEEVKVI